MANNRDETDSGNSYGIRLTLLAPEGRGHALDRIVSTLTDWVDPSRQIVDVDELSPEDDVMQRLPSKMVQSMHGSLVTPAMSIMLFVRETGNMCVDDVAKIFQKYPWKFHHKVELHNKNAPKTSLAKQEFFKIADDLPLFAACPVLTENEHLRINLYVHNFPAMVEFYRVITDTEIETNKPEFCIFELYQQPGLDIQLSLKRSPYIYPVPVESAYVSFNIKSIKMVQLGTDRGVEHMGSNVYTTRDPDGNLVVLYETSLSYSNGCYLASANSTDQSCLSSRIPSLSLETNISPCFDDVKSLKSTSESHDSGRYSDLEGQNGESVFCVESYSDSGAIPKQTGGTKSERSEGYASSSSSSLTIRNENVSSEREIDSGKRKTGQTKMDTHKLRVSGDSSTLQQDKFTPVYI